MSQDGDKCPSQFLKAQVDVFRCLVLSHQQSKAQITIIEDEGNQ